jgi:hypothetical protein
MPGQAFCGRFGKQLERRKAASGLNGQYASTPYFFCCAHEPEVDGAGSVFFEKTSSFCKIIPTPAFMPAFFFSGRLCAAEQIG